jgi:hypothetical protein
VSFSQRVRRQSTQMSSRSRPNAAAPTTPSPKERKQAPTDLEIIDLTISPVATPKKTPSKRRKTTISDVDNDTNSPSITSPEKRAKRYRDRPPQSVLVKKQRVMTQRMFLVERSGRKNGELQEEFSVLGSTGNVYVVNVSLIPTYIPSQSQSPFHLSSSPYSS